MSALEATLGRLCRPTEATDGLAKDSLRVRLQDLWRFDFGCHAWAGASNGKVMALVLHPDAAKLPTGPDEALTIASSVLWMNPKAQGSIRHKDLLAWAKRACRWRHGVTRWREVVVLDVHLNAELLVDVLEAVPLGERVRLRAHVGHHSGFIWLDVCGPGWAARIMGVVTKHPKPPVLDPLKIDAP